jgi:hypothetical protein
LSRIAAASFVNRTNSPGRALLDEPSEISGAHATRVLVSATRRNKLFPRSGDRRDLVRALARTIFLSLENARARVMGRRRRTHCFIVELDRLKRSSLNPLVERQRAAAFSTRSSSRGAFIFFTHFANSGVEPHQRSVSTFLKSDRAIAAFAENL